MDKLKEFERINLLLMRYGVLLTEVQQQIMEQYYQFDLSLQEIAENLDISRTAVQDCIKKSVKKLETYEEKLRLIRKNEQIMKLFEKFKKSNNQELIEKLERMIKNGI